MSARPPGGVDVAIAGGGPAGAAAAIMLARAGCRVVLLEKESQPQHKVCGEFLSQEALCYLESLGVDAAALGAVAIRAVRLAGRSGSTAAPLPFPAMSLTRRRLDEELLQTAEAAGAQVLRGHHVRSVEKTGEGWRLATQDAHGQTSMFRAAAAFLATGKHDLHGRPRPAGRQPGLVALKMYWQLAPEEAAALAGHVELLLFPGGYAGLQPVEDGAANLCCLIRGGDLRRLKSPGGGGRWEALVSAMLAACPHLRNRLAGAQPLLSRPLAASAIPYGYVRASSDGLWALGDQAAVIPSFTGDGMSIALHSGCLAAAMYLKGERPARFQQRLHAELKRQVALATILSRGSVRPPLQSLFAFAVSVWPGVLANVAGHTRIVKSAVLAPSSLPSFQSNRSAKRI